MPYKNKYTGAKHPFPNAYSEILTNTRKFYILAYLSVIDVLIVIAGLPRFEIRTSAGLEI